MAAIILGKTTKIAKAAKIVKAGSKLNASIRGTKEYAKQLFQQHAGKQALKVMRDRGTKRITGIRTADGSVIYRPKNGRGGVIANIEIINANGTRVNIHVQP